MIPARLLTQTVQVLTAGTVTTVDDEGNPTRPDANATSYPARLERAVSLADNAETTGGPVESVSRWLLIVQPDVPIGQHDRVVADGATFEVDGPPTIQRTPRGPHHIEARLRLVTT